jgi:hypothetical protein
LSRNTKASSKIKTTRRVKREIKHMTRSKGNSLVKVGLPKDAAYPDGTPVAHVGFWNEFGTRNSPERAWMRTSIKVNVQKYRRLNKHNLKQIQKKSMTVDVALKVLGQAARDDMIASIETWQTPPNAPSTIARKGSASVLEDTGVMKQSVTYEVIG